ncbi:hypothetical protein SRHO_G00213140 [Serrasalmus rhombeus]
MGRSQELKQSWRGSVVDSWGRARAVRPADDAVFVETPRLRCAFPRSALSAGPARSVCPVLCPEAALLSETSSNFSSRPERAGGQLDSQHPDTDLTTGSESEGG